jgi:hypothetical protein
LLCFPHASLQRLWRYLVLTDPDSRPFSLESCLKEKLTDSLSHSLIFVQTDNCYQRQDWPPAVVTAVGAENRSTIPFPISGCAGLCRPIQEVWEWPLPSVIVIRATNNSHRRIRPSDSKRGKQDMNRERKTGQLVRKGIVGDSRQKQDNVSGDVHRI